MARKLPLALLSLAAGLGTTWVGARGVGALPPLGALLSPSIAVSYTHLTLPTKRIV